MCGGDRNDSAGVRLSHLAAPASWLLFAAGAALLFRAAWQAAFSPSMDYAVVVEMARNMASGTDFPVFFYGQNYMGSLEPAVSALLCRLFGPHPVWVCMGTALFGAAALFAVMQTARRLGGDAGACFAALFAIFGGPYWIHFIVSPRGGYALAALLTAVAMAFAATVRFEDAAGRVRPSRAAALGLAAGLAFWNFWLALPAFAAAGAIILIRLRLKSFSARVLFPAAAAFLVGSAPWWLHAILVGRGSFMEDVAGPTPGRLSAVRGLFGIVVPEFLGFGMHPFGTSDFSAFWRSPFAWTLAALAAFVVAEAVFGGSRERRRMAAASALFAALFVAAYASTGFGATMAARYLTPFVPVFAIAAGGAAGAAFSRGPRWRAAALALFALHAIFVVPHAARATEALMADLRHVGMEKAAAMRRAADDPAFSEPAFSAFSLFCANWFTDRRMCFVSPLRWRYAPYLRKLEDSDSPAVIDDLLNFREFRSASGGICRDRTVEGMIVSDRIVPPPEMRGTQPGAVASMRTANGENVLAALTDDDLATGPLLDKAEPSTIDIIFDGPQTSCGVSALVAFSHDCYGWRADAIGENGEERTLSRCNPYCGWFWSGPRPYLFGPDERWELRWPPQELRRVRLTFEGALNKKRADSFCVMPVSVRVMSAEPLPPLDADAVAAAVDAFSAEMPGAKMHAGRWLARRLGGAPDPSLSLGKIGESLAFEEVCDFSAIGGGNGDIVVLRGDAAGAAEATLRGLGMRFSKKEAGGATILAIPAGGETAPGLHYFGGRIMRDSRHRTMADETSATPGGVADFGDVFRLLSVSALPESVRAGDSFDVVLTAQGIEGCDPRRVMELFVHAVRDGRILFQNIALMECALIHIPADAPRPGRLRLTVSIPPETSPGPITLEFCARWRGSRLRLKPKGDGIETDRRRLVLGKIAVR